MKKKYKIIGIIVAILFVPTLIGAIGWEYHEKPQFCANCHLIQPYVDSWTGDRVGETNGEPLLASLHASQDVICLNCHDQSIDEIYTEFMVFVKDEYRDPLKQREYDQEWCFRCHDHTSREEIIERTKDYVFDYEIEEQFLAKLAEQDTYHLGDEGQINPHNFPVDSNNMDDPHGDPTKLPDCFVCHKMHQESPGLEYCFTCHHSRVLAACSTCHEGEPGTESVK